MTAVLRRWEKGGGRGKRGQGTGERGQGRGERGQGTGERGEGIGGITTVEKNISSNSIPDHFGHYIQNYFIQD